MDIREITEDDIPALFVVRVATHENLLTREELTSLGITEATLKTRLQGTFKGWLCEINAQVVGFAISDRATGETIGLSMAYAIWSRTSPRRLPRICDHSFTACSFFLSKLNDSIALRHSAT